MGQKMDWEEIKKKYPDEWIRVTDYKLNEMGELESGTILYHSQSKEEVYSKPLSGKSEAFWYTGESTFSGLRSHAEHNDF